MIRKSGCWVCKYCPTPRFSGVFFKLLSVYYYKEIMDTKHLIVLITAPSVDVGQTIADALVDRGLAACVNIVSPIQSIFLWQGKKQNDEETLLIVKTTLDMFSSKLVPLVQEIHPYDIPEIIALPIVLGSEPYLNWIEESVKQGKP